MIRLLVISDDFKLQPLLAPALGKDFHVVGEPESEKFKQMLSDQAFDVILLDLDTTYRPIETQVNLFEELREYNIPIVALTDDGGRPTAIELVSRGLHSYCRKPPALRELKPMLRRAHEHTVMKRELERKRGGGPVLTREPEPETCDGLIGSSVQMRSVYALIRRVAHLNASVLITGESGTGKELIARAVHSMGDRNKLPFVAVSCGAIPETLIESELFGHEKGAFTGSSAVRVGYFEQAANGTLFLDEIGELSLQTQVKLLRVLQQREFSRLGSSRPIPLRARVILATHRDLGRMVKENKFRLDLYYRINVVTIKAPSLADRPSDIPVLAQHFVKQYAELYNAQVSGLTEEALQVMQEYDWPGNVRELENVIQSAIIRANGEYLEATDLPERFHEMFPTPTDEECPQVGSFERLLRDYKVKLAIKAIADCEGNKTLAARSLNISRAYLHRLIRLADDPNEADTSERYSAAQG